MRVAHPAARGRVLGLGLGDEGGVDDGAGEVGLGEERLMQLGEVPPRLRGEERRAGGEDVSSAYVRMQHARSRMGMGMGDGHGW